MQQCKDKSVLSQKHNYLSFLVVATVVGRRVAEESGR